MGTERTTDRLALTERETAALLGVSMKTLQAWRHQGRGPAYAKLGGRAIRYIKADIMAYTDAARVQPRGA